MGTNPATSFGAGADPRGEIAASPYFNPDLAPTSTAQRTWRLRDIAALWISMSACVPTYMLASSLIDEGMNWWQAVLTIFLGNIIVLVPMILNAHAGTKYGIPFPVYCRAAVRHPRRQRPGAAARPRRLRLVRHPDVDRRLGHLQDPRQSTSPSWKGLPGAFLLRHQPAAARLLPLLLGDQHVRHLPGHRVDPPAARTSRRRC